MKKSVMTFSFILLLLVFSMSFVSANIFTDFLDWFSGKSDVDLSPVADEALIVDERMPGILLAYYSFDDGTANDDTGYTVRNDGTLFGNVVCTNDFGISGGGCTFGDAGDGIAIGSVQGLRSQEGTILAWAYPTDDEVENGYVFSANGINPGRFYLQWTNGNFQVNRGETTILLKENAKLDQWYQLALTWGINGRTGESYMVGYLDGVLIGQEIDIDMSTGVFENGMIGIQGTNNRNFVGSIDEVRIYNYALSAGEVLENYNEILCMDTDGGLNYYLKGEAINSTVTIVDNCFDENILHEAFCQGTRSRSGEYGCPHGCFDGACMPPPLVSCGNGIVDGMFIETTLDEGDLKTLVLEGNYYYVSINFISSTVVKLDMGGPVTNFLAIGESDSQTLDFVTVEILDINVPDYPGGKKSVEFRLSFNEQCDDGYKLNGDGCSANCQLEDIPIVCTDSDGGKDYYIQGEVSGNIGDGYPSGVQTFEDYCLDSSTLLEHYCTPGSYVDFSESYDCPSGGCLDGKCITAGVCENGVVEAGEACDDRNKENEDGCSNTCQVETNWLCEGEPSICREVENGCNLLNSKVLNKVGELIDDGETVVLEEGEPIGISEYFILGNSGSGGGIYKVSSILNQPGEFQDKLEIYSGFLETPPLTKDKGLMTFTSTSESTGEFTLGGLDYGWSFDFSSGSSGEVIIDHPQTKSTSDKNLFFRCDWDVECGNGDVEAGETCDDGSDNGLAGMCNDLCTGVVVLELTVVHPENDIEYRNTIVPIEYSSARGSKDCYHVLSNVRRTKTNCNFEGNLLKNDSGPLAKGDYVLNVIADNSGVIENIMRAFTVDYTRKSIVSYVEFRDDNGGLKGDTTDLDFLTDEELEEVEDLTFDDDENGKIEFTEDVDLTKVSDEISNIAGLGVARAIIDIDAAISIRHNRISIDTDDFSEFDRPAILTLYDLDFDDPVIQRDGVDCVDCEIERYRNGKLVFTVTGFSRYSAVEGSGSGNNNNDGDDSTGGDDGDDSTGGDDGDDSTGGDDEDDSTDDDDDDDSTAMIFFILFIIFIILTIIIVSFMIFKNNKRTS